MGDQRMKEERLGDTGKAGSGDTVPVQGENQAPKPRMPHERDESADSQAAGSTQARRMGQIAHDSEVTGKDTGKGPVLDAAYEKQMGGDEKKRRQ